MCDNGAAHWEHELIVTLNQRRDNVVCPVGGWQ